MAVKESYVKVQEIIMKAPSFSNAAQTSNIGGYIVAPTGPRLAYIQSPAQFLATYTKDGKVPRKADITFINAYYLSYASGLVLARASNTTAVSGLLFVSGVTEPIKVVFKDGSLMTKKANLKIQFDKAAIDAGTSWALAVGNTVYYYDPTGNITDNDEFAPYQNFVEVTGPKDLAACFEGMDNIHVASWSYAQGTIKTGDDKDDDKYNLNLVLNFTENEGHAEEDDELYIPNIYTEAVVKSAAYSNDGDIISQASDTWIMAIKMGQTNTQGDYNFSLRNYNLTTKTFDLVFKNNLTIDETTGKASPTTELYTVSMYPEVYDRDGVNLYIDWLNNQGLPFTVEVFKDENDLLQPYSDNDKTRWWDLGSDGYSQEESKEDSNLFAALTVLAEQELYDIEYLAPMGITRMPVVKRLKSIGEANKWFCPIDAPYDRLTFTAVKKYFNSLGLDATNVPSGIAMGPFDKNSSLCGFNAWIAASTLYYERVMANKAQQAEFAPVFKQNYGILNYTNPAKLFKKSEREALLSSGRPINWAVYDQRRDVYYLNDNRTYQSKDDIVKEEQNARLVWKISKDLIRILDQFIGKYNTRATRQQVHDVINYYFNWSIMNQRFPPEAYEIICDESNNPAELIRENKMAVEVRIRLYNAIKYIEVINRVFPLGVDFNTSISEA